jgi:hypothetical protein
MATETFADWWAAVPYPMGVGSRDIARAAWDAAVAAEREQTAYHESKWREYERDFILPQFEWAESVGIDLRALVRDNPGKNCSRLLFETMEARVRDKIAAAIRDAPPSS